MHIRYIGIAILVIGGAVLIFNHDRPLIRGISNDAVASLIASIAILVVLGSALLGDSRISTLFKSTVVWICLFVVLMGGYAYREEVTVAVDRVLGELSPIRPVTSSDGQSVTLRRDVRGHFSARGFVNNQPIQFLIDTGATRVTLSHDDAQAIGIDMGRLRFTATVFTGNGQVQVAPLRLETVRIGGIEVRNVTAFVAPEDALRGSLLGMSFLSKLPGYTVRGDQMTLLAP